ncbi:MAG: type II secretion system protein [Candidatus Pacebacteria bacterium]|nr:type II secretion system protein [Candidatus Paceibacterota bacterium]
MKLPKVKKIRGFTLIELLVVIGVIGILAAIVLVAVNPARNFAQARDTQRRNDIYQVLNACHQFAVSNDGSFPTGITTAPQDIGTDGLNLEGELVTDFIPAIPMDPSSGTAATTGYVLFEEADGRLTASATGELATITITR